MKTKFKNTILFDFLLGVIVVLALLIGISTYINIANQKSAIIDRMSENISSQGIILKEIGKGAIVYGEIRTAQDILVKLKEKSVVDIYKLSFYKFMDNNGKGQVLATTDYEKLGAIIEDEQLNEALQTKKIYMRVNVIDGKEYYEYIFAITENNRLVGAFDYVISSDVINSSYKKILISNIMLAVIALVLIIFFTSLLLYYRVYGPIIQLTKEVRKIKDGEIAYDVKLNIENEFGDLAKEINQMKASIWKTSFENRMANPITGLMGLIDTIEIVNEKIENKEMFGVISINLKNINPYKIKYGINSGEDIIRTTFEAIEKVCIELNLSEYKLTQIGESQFLMLLIPEIAEDFAKKFIEEYDLNILSLYKEKATGEKLILTNVNEEEKEYPLIIAELGVLNSSGDLQFLDYRDIEEKILEIEEKYYEENEKSFYVLYTKEGIKSNSEPAVELSEMEEDADDFELEEDLLSGLEEL